MANILVMEDDADQAALLKDALEGFGHSVQITYSGAEAWVYLQSASFDILITDIYVDRAPGTERGNGGISLIGKVCNASPRAENYDALANLKIIAVTGGAELPEGYDPLELANRFGANVCLRKPIDLLKLSEIIDGLLPGWMRE